MKIGIDGSRAFIKNRTGIEEYSYQVIKRLRNKLTDQQIIIYIKKNQSIDFELPENWKIKIINLPYLWTQLGLSMELLFHSVDVLFIPAHVVPLIHPKNTIVTVHGLEYEFCPKAYSSWARMYMRWSIKFSCRWAKKIISVSQNTRRDLIRLYKVADKKIQVIYEGYEEKSKIQNPNVKSQTPCLPAGRNLKSQISNLKPYLLFVGRLEERKNVIGIIKIFEMLKEKYNISQKLVLAGKSGYGFSQIELAISISKYKNDIIQLGFVRDEDKFTLIAGADIFVFPTFYEGFGIPVLEAQSVGVPVVTSNTSSMPEVSGDSAILVDPMNNGQIADAIYELISNKTIRENVIKRGYENAKRFSWEKCAAQIVEVLV